MTTWAVIGRGKAGWHATARPGPWYPLDGGGRSRTGQVSSSGGDLSDYVPAAEPGALVYDASEADPEAFVEFSVGGPMLSLDLAPDAVNRFSFGARSVALAMSGPGGLQGEFRALALAVQEETFTGLDYVGVDVYQALLRRVPGVRFGRVRDGAVQWEGSAA